MDRCNGVWANVLINIGMDQTLFNGRYHDCIYCGRKKKARWQVRKMRYVCSCGCTQPIQLAMDYLGHGFKETVIYIENNALGGYMEPVKQTDDLEKSLRTAKEIHKGLKQITSDTAAGKYLLRRGVKQPPINLYAHDSLEYWYLKDDKWQSVTFPGMIAVSKNSDGVTQEYQRFYLTPEGYPAKVRSPKKTLKFGSSEGCTVNLSAAYGNVLAVSEGVVNGLLFQQNEGVPTKACLDANRLENFIVPEGVKHLYIIEDYDMSFTGRKAAANLAYRVGNTRKDVKVSIASMMEHEGTIVMHIITPERNIDYADYTMLCQ
jgi:hypothetical protein